MAVGSKHNIAELLKDSIEEAEKLNKDIDKTIRKNNMSKRLANLSERARKEAKDRG
ncbi:hypothetical protein IW140_002984 [Coemansia sp. RSA 1813]|nr:hypothetical protein EV179_004317 [Coemansia sp. RSA 487]KAJ2569576.1 hypothetical protein IW140_002984 [Coemansia sp. RSA 1813]